ncbi:MAG: hypothetical protein CL927_15300 [Deltaproteobacteria bacterium]|nr:hypothetical protein [Deltaproteobacteria bacterium]HCH64520.1 hypothetical protein [Deltaproteobacteria bacterium]
MPDRSQPNNPLHGITLKTIVEDLHARHGWEGLARLVPVRCFQSAPSIKSSLKFLRRTPWARQKVERLYIADQKTIARKKKRNAMRAARRAYKAELAVEAEAGPEESVTDRDREPGGDQPPTSGHTLWPDRAE